MRDDDLDGIGPDGLTAPRPCPVCDSDLVPEVIPSADGLRIALVCPTHGVATIIDPFA